MNRITTSADAVAVLDGLFSRSEQEEAWILSLTSANTVKDAHLVGLGSDTAVILSPKVIAKHAVLDMACGVILAHNHPSGDPRPSTADMRQTEALRSALHLFDINLLDHIIVANDSFYSFSDEKVTKRT